MKTSLLVVAIAGLAAAAPQPSLHKRVPAAVSPGYQQCGGHVINPRTCPKGYICVDNPRSCSQAADCPGICVQPQPCGGFAGLPCPAGKKCYDDPRDDCWPQNGGADCIGICI
ncbi:hypothetical protein TWF696_003322 [Orbilia brochopaga]|uniref:Uncharacterized protein n=1 Tax=Orbilia brochopaga TaxID=3140254 RepID=A0AAV9TXM7_9PEZI